MVVDAREGRGQAVCCGVKGLTNRDGVVTAPSLLGLANQSSRSAIMNSNAKINIICNRTITSAASLIAD